MRILLLIAAFFMASCGDSFDSGEIPQLNISIDSQSHSNDFTAFFGQAIQRQIIKTVKISNGGTADLKIDSIAWEIDEDGNELKNPYVSLDFRNAIDDNSFPYIIDPKNMNELSIAVVYNPPLSTSVDDFSKSVLLIKSNSRRSDTRERNPEFRVTFSLQDDVQEPRVSPTRFTFSNAGPGRPESQDFRIYNDPQVATAPFTITNVRLANNDGDFEIRNAPNAGTVVLGPNDPSYEDVVFSVVFQPKTDAPQSNVLIIETDAPNSMIQVPLSSQASAGSYSLSFDHPDHFDFTNERSETTRSVLLTSDGDSTIRIAEPQIVPTDAEADYRLRVYKPATSPDGEDSLVDSWPRGLAAGNSLLFEVTYLVPEGGRDSANGELIISVDNAEPRESRIPILSGEPKAGPAFSPKTRNINVSGAAGDSGSRNFVVFNEGNGPLQVKNIVLENRHGESADAWTYPNGQTSFTVAPYEMAVLKLDYHFGTLSSASDKMFITYFDDYTQEDEDILVELMLQSNEGKALPEAALSAQGSEIVGETIVVSAASSTASDGNLNVPTYLIYLTAKPAGSKVSLNVQGQASGSFVPDLPGTYTFEAVVAALTGEGNYLYSQPKSLSITVAAE